jgi:hypothetical protein
MVSGWQREIGSEFLAPLQKKDFAKTYSLWADAIEIELARRIGDEQKKAA